MNFRSDKNENDPSVKPQTGFIFIISFVIPSFISFISFISFMPFISIIPFISLIFSFFHFVHISFIHIHCFHFFHFFLFILFLSFFSFLYFFYIFHLFYLFHVSNFIHSIHFIHFIIISGCLSVENASLRISEFGLRPPKAARDMGTAGARNRTGHGRDIGRDMGATWGFQIAFKY